MNERKGKLNSDEIANGNFAIRIQNRIPTPTRPRQEVYLGNSNSKPNSASDSNELKLVLSTSKPSWASVALLLRLVFFDFRLVYRV